MRFLAAFHTSALTAQPTAQLIILRLAVDQLIFKHRYTFTHGTNLTAQLMAASHSLVTTCHSTTQQHTQHSHNKNQKTNHPFHN